MSKKEKKKTKANVHSPIKVISKTRHKSRFKFDMKTILNERLAENDLWEKNAELDKKIKIVDDLFQKEINEINIIPKSTPPILSHVIFDHSKYNLIFKDNLDCDTTKSFSWQLLKMSIEESELTANTYFNYLLAENFSPVLNDVTKVLSNWGADVNNSILKSSLMYLNFDKEKIGHHNFELVFNFLSRCIQKNNHGFYKNDLLTLAKFTVTILLDSFGAQMIDVIKELFCSCIEAAFFDNEDTSVVAFSQELYSQHDEEFLLKIVPYLLLPIESPVMKKIYTLLTFKLFKSFLGITNNMNAFPSGIKDWFVQDLVNQEYFAKNPKILKNVICLLEHVVLIFDLNQDEVKFGNMYEFLKAAVGPITFTDSFDLINILDMWRLTLFRKQIMNCLL